jgi:hypothetical protein
MRRILSKNVQIFLKGKALRIKQMDRVQNPIALKDQIPDTIIMKVVLIRLSIESHLHQSKVEISLLKTLQRVCYQDLEGRRML